MPIEPSNAEQALNKALFFIKYRPRSEKEVRDRLRQKGYDKSVIENTIDKLKNDELIDDSSFAKLWAEVRVASKKIGPGKLKSELREKGISPEVVDSIIESVYLDSSQEGMALELLEKKFRNTPMPPQEKVIGFLVRNGYNFSFAQKVYKLLRKKQKESED